MILVSTVVMNFECVHGKVKNGWLALRQFTRYCTLWVIFTIFLPYYYILNSNKE